MGTEGEHKHSWIGIIKDVLVPLTAVLYILGFLVWGLFALEFRLGAVSVVDAQYVVAGVVPLLIMTAAAAMIAFPLRAIAHWLKRDPTESQRKLGSVLTAMCPIVILGGFVIAKITGSSIEGYCVASGLVMAILGAFLKRNTARVDDRTWQRAGLGYAKFAVVAGAIAAFALYWSRVFPYVPQELGGPAPRCVALDLEVARLSPETRVLAFGDSDPSGPIRRSKELYVIRSADDFLLLSPSSTIEHGLELYRIDRKSVAAMLPCGR